MPENVRGYLPPGRARRLRMRRGNGRHVLWEYYWGFAECDRSLVKSRVR